MVSPSSGRLSQGWRERRPIFFYSQVVWDEVWQRPQEVALRLARRRPVIYFSPVQVHRLYDSLRRRPFEELRAVTDEGADLRVASPLILPGEYRSRLARAFNAALIRAEVRGLVGDGAGVTFLTNSPFSEPLLRGFRWRATAYDVIDDYAAFEWAPRDSVERHDRLVRECDLVYTGTHAMLEKVRAVRPEAEYVAGGVRFERFHREANDDSPTPPTPPELSALSGPIIGYTGTLSDRIDRDLIARAAERYPQAHFVFIGPIHGSFGAPPRAANIHYLGLKPHEALPDYVNRFDLAIMPFLLTQATLAINPVKTLEYLAAGRLTLSTAIPDIERFYSDVVVVAKSAEEFVDRIGELLEGDHGERRAKGIEKARKASWDTTAERVAALLEVAERMRK